MSGFIDTENRSSVLAVNKVNNIAASFQRNVVETLTEKTIAAAEAYGCEHVAIAGGVASNTALRSALDLIVQHVIIENGVLMKSMNA